MNDKLVLKPHRELASTISNRNNSLFSRRSSARPAPRRNINAPPTTLFESSPPGKRNLIGSPYLQNKSKRLFSNRRGSGLAANDNAYSRLLNESDILGSTQGENNLDISIPHPPPGNKPKTFVNASSVLHQGRVYHQQTGSGGEPTLASQQILSDQLHKARIQQTRKPRTNIQREIGANNSFLFNRIQNAANRPRLPPNTLVHSLKRGTVGAARLNSHMRRGSPTNVGYNEVARTGNSLMTRSKSNGPNSSTVRHLQTRLNKTPAPRKPMTAHNLVMIEDPLNSTMPLTSDPTQVLSNPSKQRENSALFNELNRSYIETLARGAGHHAQDELRFRKASSQFEIKKGVNPQIIAQCNELIEQGKVLLLERNYMNAIKQFNKVLKADKMNIHAKFYRGIAWLDLQKPQKAVTDFEDVLDTKPNYNKTVYLCLSVAQRRVHKNQEAVRTLTQAIVKYPRYVDALVARGQLFLALKKYEKALVDFKQVIQLDPQSDLGYIWQGDAHKGNGNNAGAVWSYTQAIEVNPESESAIQRRAMLFYSLNKLETSLQDFSTLLALNDSNSRAHFFKGKILHKLGSIHDATLHFEQVIKYDNNQSELTGNALFEIAKIRVKEKDFYEASFNLQRAQGLKFEAKGMKVYKMFSDSVIDLMKSNHQQAVKALTNLVDSNSVRGYLHPLIYLYRAYGFVYLEKYEKALKDYVKAGHIKSQSSQTSYHAPAGERQSTSHSLDQQQQYNKILIQGIISLLKSDFEVAVTLFNRSHQRLPNQKDPFFYIAFTIIRHALGSVGTKDADTGKILLTTPEFHRRKEMLEKAREFLDKATQMRPKDEHCRYYRGLLLCFMHNFFDAISEFQEAINRSDDSIARYYLFRGISYACLGMFKEAIKDFNITISLDQNLVLAYLNRGKCAYLSGDTSLAFSDFQKLILIEPNNHLVHIYAGNLLMTTGAYEDAIKALSNANNLKVTSLAVYQKARCYAALNNLQQSMSLLKTVLKRSPTNVIAFIDFECLTAIKHIITHATSSQDNNSEENRTLPKKQSSSKKPIDLAIAKLTALIALQISENHERLRIALKQAAQNPSEKEQSSTPSSTHYNKTGFGRRKDSHSSQGGRQGSISPRSKPSPHAQKNMKAEDEVTTLSLDTITISKHLLGGEVPSKEQIEGGTFSAYEEAIPTENFARLYQQQLMGGKAQLPQKLSSLNNNSAQNIYKENIFNTQDFYLYRAVAYFYCENFHEALINFEKSSQKMHSDKVIPTPRRPDSDNDDSDCSVQTDLSDVGLCSLNVHEFSYNVMICLIQMGQYKKALQKCTFLIETVPHTYLSQLWIIRAILNNIDARKDLAKDDFERALKYDPQNTKRLIEEQKQIKLDVFPQEARLCTNLPRFALNFGTLNFPPILVRLSFSFPFIKPPNMIPSVDQAVLQDFVQKLVIPKIEAPWIKRCDFGIKFTDQIYYIDNEPVFSQDQQQEKKDHQTREAQSPVQIKRHSSQPPSSIHYTRGPSQAAERKQELPEILAYGKQGGEDDDELFDSGAMGGKRAGRYEDMDEDSYQAEQEENRSASGIFSSRKNITDLVMDQQ